MLRDPKLGAINLEDPANLSRFLGCNHIITENDSGRTIEFEMEDYLHQAIEKYTSLSGAVPLKKVATPFLPYTSLPVEDSVEAGELASDACGVLMKNLYLARLSRPDLLKAINELAKRVTRWSKNDDKQLCRLMSYMNSSSQHRLVAEMRDCKENLRLDFFVDSDFSGDPADTKSTSGGWLVLSGPNSSFPLTWVSRRQTATSRSTTEAETIAMASILFTEVIPLWDWWELVLQRPIKLCIHEDNQATIAVISKGFSPKLRHVSRTHKVDLGSLFEVFKNDNLSLEYVSTDKQCADIFTKQLEPHKWDAAIKLLGIRVSRTVAGVSFPQLQMKEGGVDKYRILSHVLHVDDCLPFT